MPSEPSARARLALLNLLMALLVAECLYWALLAAAPFLGYCGLSNRPATFLALPSRFVPSRHAFGVIWHYVEWTPQGILHFCISFLWGGILAPVFSRSTARPRSLPAAVHPSQALSTA